MLALAAAMTVALVTSPQTTLASSPDEKAAKQATLARGDWLEVRGELRGRLKVYDHRHERPGYVQPWQVRTFPLDESAAPALRTIVGFVRDEPGAESLGIGATALFLKVAPAAAIGPDVLDALGTMAERLARRATRGAAVDELEVAKSYGIAFYSLESPAGVRVCYDGEAFRRVLASPAASGEAKARAALALSDPTCAAPVAGLAAEQAALEGRLAVLDAVSGAPPFLAGRVRIRRVGLLATLAWLRARQGDATASAAAAGQAFDTFAGIERLDLAAEDGAAYQEAAVRVAVARWLREPAATSPGEGAHLELAPGKEGETCVRLVAGKKAEVERCTFGLPLLASVRKGPKASSVAIAVQLLPGWVEVWLFRRAGDGWIVDPIVPAETDPELGYAEVAGFSPDGKRVLVVREARAEVGGLRRTFEVRLVATLAVELQARSAAALSAFARFSSPDWKRGTVALR
jgi:hypothetical protein